MKKCIAAVLLAATLCTCLLLPGCASKKQGIVATGEYNGMKITLRYDGPLEYPAQEYGSLKCSNGYIVFEDNGGEYGNEYWNVSGFILNAMDRQGNRVFHRPYQAITDRQDDGYFYAYTFSGTYVRVDIEGNETQIPWEEFHKRNLGNDDEQRAPLPKEVEYSGEDADLLMGIVWEGLAAYTVPANLPGGNDKLLGIADAEGNIIIPACLPVNYDIYTERLFICEDTLVFRDGEHIGIAYIERG